MTYSQFSYRNANPSNEEKPKRKSSMMAAEGKAGILWLSSRRCTGNLGVHKTRVLFSPSDWGCHATHTHSRAGNNEANMVEN